MTLKTMLAAAAVTIGMLAHGALQSGTSFETFDTEKADVSVDKAALEAADTGATWTLPANQTVTAYGSETPITGDARPAQFATASQENYLAVKTTLGEYVTRNAGAQTIGAGGLYVDTLVKFTAADEDIAVPSDAKIGVWVKTNEEETENRLMISAGPSNDGVATVYDCGTLTDADAWKRLTVKAIYNPDGQDSLAFVVYVDGAAVSGGDAAVNAFAGKTLTPNAAKFAINGNLFPSLANDNKLSEIAVSGQGGIDDISFTDVAPDFAKDYEFITLTFDTAKIAKLYVTDAEGNLQEFTSSPASYEIIKGETAKSYYYDAQPGYISVGAGDAIAIEGTSVEIADPAAEAFKIGENAYATWAKAVAAAVDGAKTIALVADYTMTETDLTASINNTGLTTLDLNGKTLTGCVNAVTAIAITNSTENIGALAYAENDQTMTAVNGAAVYVSAGKFDGFVIPTEETPTKSITGGSFAELGTGSEAFYLAANVADGYEAVYAAGYWTVQEAAPSTAQVTISAENVTVTVMAGETQVASGDSVAVGTELTITATPAKDYELATLTVKGEAFTSGSTYTVVEGDAGKTIEIAATATAIPTFTVTFSTNTVTVAEATLDGVLRGTALAKGQIPAFAGGAWDVDPVGAVIVCDTNFNYTIQSTVDPVVPGEEIKTDKTPAEINADPTIKAQFLNAPAGATVDASVYNTYFDAVAGATPGTVKFELNATGAEALQANANSEIIKIKPNEIAALTTESGKFRVETTLPGFYYAVKQGNGIGNMKVVAAGVLATDAKGVELDFVKYNGAGFYKIVVSPTPINPEN